MPRSLPPSTASDTPLIAPEEGSARKVMAEAVSSSLDAELVPTIHHEFHHWFTGFLID